MLQLRYNQELMEESYNDQQLIADFLVGDDESFEFLVKKYLKYIYNFIHLFIRDRDALDDLTQVTFIKVWKSLKRFDQAKNFKVWIFAIAKNTAYDYLKKKKTIPFSNFIDEEGNNSLENIREERDVLPDEILHRKDLAKEIEEKLGQLSDSYRIILMMRYKDDLSLSEISEILNIPYNTIKSHHQRALQSLRKLF